VTAASCRGAPIRRSALRRPRGSRGFDIDGRSNDLLESGGAGWHRAGRLAELSGAVKAKAAAYQVATIRSRQTAIITSDDLMTELAFVPATSFSSSTARW